MEMSVDERVMRIGWLSKSSGISKQLIHYYLRMGYLHPPIYKKGNQAFYGQTHLERLIFLKRCNSEAIPLSYASSMWERSAEKKNRNKQKYQTGDNSESTTRAII